MLSQSCLHQNAVKRKQVISLYSRHCSELGGFQLSQTKDLSQTIAYLSSSFFTSKCMHDMNQTEAEYSRHGKGSQRASLSQIGPVVLEV